MFKSIAAFTFVMLSSVPVVAGAATSIPINASANCFDTTSLSGGVARFQLAPGRYVASLVNNKMSCSGGQLTGGCLINSATISGSLGNARWGLSVRTPTVVDIPGSTNFSFTAFVVDNNCSDNTGTASLLFQKAN